MAPAAVILPTHPSSHFSLSLCVFLWAVPSTCTRKALKLFLGRVDNTTPQMKHDDLGLHRPDQCGTDQCGTDQCGTDPGAKHHKVDSNQQ